jgi:hypothetical protein
MNRFILVLLLIVCSALFAEEPTPQKKSPLEFTLTTSAAYYPMVDHKTGSSHFSGISGAYDGVEAVTEFDATYTMPFLNGSDELTVDNHLAFKLGLELSPVTIAPVASVTFSPIAFLEFAIGGTIGTGWPLTDDIQGLAKLDESKPKYKNLTPFANWYFYTWASGCFMFDLAAIWEGDWHHVVTTATYKAGYQKMTGTKSTVWGWQNSYGLADGWVYEQEYFLGYQMPLKVSMIGVGATLWGNYQSSDYGKFSSNYDGDFMTIDIWPMVEIKISKKDLLYVLTDFRARRSFREKYDDDAHEPFMTKTGREWLFYSIAAQWKHTF